MRGRAPFPVDARLSVYIEVHIGPVNGRAVGDLDNFVTGVLDALQAAPAGLATQQGLIPQTTPYGGAIVFEDDASVVHLEARKVVGAENQHYTVRVGVER